MKEIWFFRTPVIDFDIDDSEDEEDDDDMIAVPFESDSLPSVGFIFSLQKTGRIFFSRIVNDNIHLKYSKWK